MSSDVVIKVKKLGKCYQIYDSPGDRLRQFIYPRLQRASQLATKQYYSEFWALRDVSFEVRRGETVGIIGKNGCGKSTLLQIICGTLHPSNGTVETIGRVAALLELGSGFNPEFTGRENIYLNATVLGLSKDEVDKKFEDIVSFADIGEFIEQPVKTYSSGMVVRLAFAVIAHVEADILVIDEALSVGDAFFVQKCMRFLRQFMERGTVLFVSHDTGAVLNLCQKAVWLQTGVIAAHGNPKEITEKYLEKLYESQQGESAINNSHNATLSNNAEKPMRDMRLDFINRTTLRNDIEIFQFSPDSPGFGKGGVVIEVIELLDENGTALSWVVGGERVNLVVNCVAQEKLFSVIVGFQVKDRLGQVIFADNTFLSYAQCPLGVSKSEKFLASFDFFMPVMPNGDYSISIAVADGTQDEHVQHQWIHDALKLKVHSTSICHGLFGVVMNNINLERI